MTNSHSTLVFTWMKWQSLRVCPGCRTHTCLQPADQRQRHRWWQHIAAKTPSSALLMPHTSAFQQEGSRRSALLREAEVGWRRFCDLWESLAVLFAMGEHCGGALGTSQPLCDKTWLLPAKGLREQPKWKRDQEPKTQGSLCQPNHVTAPQHSGGAPTAPRGEPQLRTHPYINIEIISQRKKWQLFNFIYRYLWNLQLFCIAIVKLTS